MFAAGYVVRLRLRLRMLAPANNSKTPPPPAGDRQFSLRYLLLWITGIALSLAWPGY